MVHKKRFNFGFRIGKDEQERMNEKNQAEEKKNKLEKKPDPDHMDTGIKDVDPDMLL